MIAVASALADASAADLGLLVYPVLDYYYAPSVSDNYAKVPGDMYSTASAINDYAIVVPLHKTKAKTLIFLKKEKGNKFIHLRFCK